MSQRYNDNTRRPKLKENQLRNLKRALGPGERATGVTYLSECNHKSWCIFPLKFMHLSYTHASYKTTTTWENFNNWGTEMILLSDKLWSIANNSKSFTNGSKSIIWNNLGLCALKFTLFRTFKNIHWSNGVKI